MNIEELRHYCLSLKNATEDIKWETSLCFCIKAKIFCMVPLEGALSDTFKVPAADYNELAARDGFRPAKYLARAKWVTLTDITAVTTKELQGFIKQSYELISSKTRRK